MPLDARKFFTSLNQLLVRRLTGGEHAGVIHRSEAGAFAGGDMQQVLHFKRRAVLDHAEHDRQQNRCHDRELDRDARP